MPVVNLFGELALESTQQQLAADLEAGNGVRAGMAADAGQTAAAADELVMLLEQILSRLGMADPATAAHRVLPTGGTVTTVGTVTTQSQMSGISTIYDQYAAMNTCAQGVRNRITFT